MTELINRSPSSIVTSPAHAEVTTDALKSTTDAAALGITWIRRLLLVNLGLVALQPLSAGFFLSGYERAVTIHAGVAIVLQFGALVQAITAVVLWRRHRLPARVARISVALFVLVFLQSGFGYAKLYWLHVPLGVGMFGGLARQLDRLDAHWRTNGAPS